jgi:hypothetical protein
MNTLSSRLQMTALGYAAVLVIAAVILYARHLQELLYPAEASGGMWAAGDAMLYVFIACLFLLPTIFFFFVTAKFESFYVACSRFLLGVSLSAPVCLGSLWLGDHRLANGFLSFCLYRLLCSPFLLVGIGASWLAARFDRAKRLVSCALVVEGLTLGVAVALLLRVAGAHGR